MGSCSPRLPLICLSDQTLKPGSSKWVKVRSDVRKALEDYGCFEAQCDQVSTLQESVLEAMKEIFALPKEMKQRYVSPKPFPGYLATHNDLHESMGIQDANILENAHDFTRQLWPESEGNKSMSKAIQLFSEKLTELDVMVRRLVMESFGLEKYIDEHLTSTHYRLRLMKYIAPPDNADGDVNVNDDGASVGVKVNVDVGDDVNDNVHVDVNADVDDGTNVNGDVDAEANGDATAYAYVDVEEAKLGGLPGHTDKSLLGITYQYDQGLEVKTKEGKWITVKPAPDRVIVIAGDALCALMNGRIIAAYHRVRVTEKTKTRHSTVLFSITKAGYIIDSPKELVDEKHPRLFKPFDLVDLFNFFKTEAGRKAQSPLHAFCAVSEK